MKRKSIIRQGYRLAIGLFLLTLGFGSQQACLPGPTSLQVEAVINCQSAAEPVQSGTMDVAILDSYYMKINLINMLVITADPGLFRPETNFVDLKEMRVWFEYPNNFSLQASGSQLLKTQENPYVLPIAHTLRPSLQGDFLGQQAGATGGAAPTGQPVEFRLIPTELTRIWSDAGELKNSLINTTAKRQSGASFQIIAHITVSGITRAGQIVATPEYRFPIRICKGCLDASKQDKDKPSLCGGGASAGATGVDCTGQDGVCFSNQQGGG